MTYLGLVPMPAISAVTIHYQLAIGTFLVVGGRLGDRYGKRWLFLIRLSGFVAASLLCGLSVDPAMIYTYTSPDDPAREDDGLFGPESVTWRLMSSPDHVGGGCPRPVPAGIASAGDTRHVAERPWHHRARGCLGQAPRLRVVAGPGGLRASRDALPAEAGKHVSRADDRRLCRRGNVRQ